MSKVPNDKKQSRNKPCPCGSGKKYKRCCGKDAEPKTPNIIPGPGLDPQVANKLKNDFRKQFNPFVGIPSEEIVRRDQTVYLAKLEMTYNMGELDKGYYANIIANFEALKRTVQSIQPCPERGPTLTDIETQLVEFTKRAKTTGLNRSSFLTLVALRSVLGVEDAEPEKESSYITPQDALGDKPIPEKGEIQVEEDKVIEQVLGSTGQKINKPRGDGPIMDEGNTNPESDFSGGDDNKLADQVNQNLKR